MSLLRQACEDALQHANVQAWLRVIREGETSQTDEAYYTIVGGERAASLADHPRKRVWIERINDYSTAAGAYQFRSRTWDECKSALGLLDFTPPSQDLAAVYLTRRRGALDDVIAGRLESAIEKCAQEWASLPGDAYGQGGITMQRARDVYLQWGGTMSTYEGADSAQTQQGEQPMAPIIPAIVGPLVGELAALIPRVATLWKGKSEVAERNVALGTAILETITKSVGAANAQDAVEKVRADPEAARAAREAIDREWGKLDEMREVSIEKARDLYKQSDRIVVGNMVFHELLALVIILLCAAGMVAAFGWGNLSQSTKDNIVMLALVGGFIGIKEFFYGGSRGSDTKTALLDRERSGR